MFLFLTLASKLQSFFSLLLSRSLNPHNSHFHSQICNEIKLIHLHPQPATSLSHAIFIFKLASQPHPSLTPDLESYDTHHTGTPNLQSPTLDLGNQSGSHLPLSHPTLNRVTTHTRYDFFFLSIFVFIFFNICSVILCICWYILTKKSEFELRVVFWLIFFCIKKSVILCILWTLCNLL
jgi:hypothetical protein